VDEKLTARARLIYERDNNSPLFLRVADDHIRKKDFTGAISILENGLKVFPDHPVAMILISKAYAAMSEYEGAESWLKKACEILNSERAFIHYKKEFGLPDKKFSPFDSSRGSVFFNSSDDEQLSEITILKAEPGKIDSVDERLPQIAEELMNRKPERTNDVEFQSTNHQEFSPDKSKLASETLANIFLSQGQKSEALKIYELLAQRNPDKREYYLGKIRQIQAQ